MKIGNLVKHITQDKWGVILEIMDFSDTDASLKNKWVEILWSDEAQASWVWDDLLKVIDAGR